MPPTLESRVEAAVAAMLEQRNGTVEQLIGEALDRRLGELVATELETRAIARPAPPDQVASPGTKVCKLCQVEKPRTEFETGRAQCRACRRRQERERAARRAGGDNGAPEG